jgi:hypothetical protein
MLLDFLYGFVPPGQLGWLAVTLRTNGKTGIRQSVKEDWKFRRAH